MKSEITHYCQIKNGKVIFDENLLYEDKEVDFQKFIKNAYQFFELDYRKFYKMDPLCKLAVMNSSVLIANLTEKLDPKTALLLTNKSACVDIDLKHQKSITEGFARPADFVYTLPNISLGEISIKNKLRSENSFFIFETFNPEFLITYTQQLIQTKKANAVLAGWVEIAENDYNALLFLVEKKKGIALKKENLLNLI